LKIDLRGTSEADAATVSAFLTGMLKPKTSLSYAADAHMQWKYWTARPDWDGSRSFTAGTNGTIHAHAAAIRRADDHAPRDAVEFDQGQGRRELIAGCDENGTSGELWSQAAEARAVSELPQGNARGGAGEMRVIVFRRAGQPVANRRRALRRRAHTV
jgi:hypothetical protein